MHMEKDIISIIQEKQRSFSKGQNRIARYISENADKAAFMTAAKVFAGLKRSTEAVSVRLKKLENADLFLDLPLYFGLLGTVASFIVMSFNPNISRLIAYSSTLVGIIFSVILRITLQYPLKQTLICAAENESNGKESEQ